MSQRPRTSAAFFASIAPIALLCAAALSTPLFAIQEAVEFNLHNLFSRACEQWEPLKPGRATVYTCGPRLQRPLQLAEARRFVLADLLCRYLRWQDCGRIIAIGAYTRSDIETSDYPVRARRLGESLA